MAKKMYYNGEEAAAKLGISPAALAKLVADGKLRVFKDGPQSVHRVDEVDALAESGGVAAEEEIELTPADSNASGSSIISLADTAETPTAGGKGDTVITAEGVSIFDETESGLETADPMAKTQITMSMEDQAAIEGAGTGSGLLDLTRERDDTSLGEVLDRIDVEGPALAEEPAPGEPALAVPAAAAPMVAQIDPPTGFLHGLLVGSAAVAMVLGAVALAAMMGVVPRYLQILASYKLAVLAGCAVVIGAAGGLGFFFAQAAIAKKAGHA